MLVAFHSMGLLCRAGQNKAAIVVKWHLGVEKMYQPNDQEFHSFLGIPYSHDISHDMCSCKTCSIPMHLVSVIIVIILSPVHSTKTQI